MRIGKPGQTVRLLFWKWEAWLCGSAFVKRRMAAGERKRRLPRTGQRSSATRRKRQGIRNPEAIRA